MSFFAILFALLIEQVRPHRRRRHTRRRISLFLHSSYCDGFVRDSGLGTRDWGLGDRSLGVGSWELDLLLSIIT